MSPIGKTLVHTSVLATAEVTWVKVPSVSKRQLYLFAEITLSTVSPPAPPPKKIYLFAETTLSTVSPPRPPPKNLVVRYSRAPRRFLLRTCEHNTDRPK